nr:CHAT domain-containing protein [uncultured Rhodopila sp.]
MQVVLTIDGTFVSLLCPAARFDKRRTLDAAPLAAIASRYAALREQPDAAKLPGLGRDLYCWLDGEGSWLATLRAALQPPFLFEVRAPAPLDDSARAVLHAPWELLADETGFLAADATLRFAPARRLGSPCDPAPFDDYRLAVAFMAAAPRGATELDYEAEETAILTAARQNLDLLVEDSGDPEELGRRLAALHPPPPVLHLSCHGHNAWKENETATPLPVLMMEQATGAARPTPAADLLSTLRPYTPRLLFLSACLTAAAGGGAAAPDTLAGSLIRAGFPAVLGWDGSVADVAATAFAHVLYDGLARRQSVTEAAAGARRALLLGHQPGGGTSGGKDFAGDTPPGLDAQLASARDALQRDWHLARVWLGPEGGGAVIGGTRRRSLLPPDHGQKLILARKKDDALAVAEPAMFVGRRRELQTALRLLADGDRAGLLLHGLGRVGKSSLAARISNRRPDLQLAVVYGDYDSLSVIDALADALKAHAPARQMLAERRAAVRENPAALEALLIDLLAGPCREAEAGDKPVLLLIDDLERILQADPDGGRHRVRAAERPVLQAVLRAFDPALSESRLILTSRFPFTLRDDNGEELTDRLHERPLSRFAAGAQRKLSLRQVAAARTRPAAAARLDDAALAARLPLLRRAESLARGNPGLQDLIGDRLVLRPAVGLDRAAAVLDQMTAYLEGGSLPDDEQVRQFLQNLAVDELLAQATPAGRDLLRAALLFDIPVPAAVIETLAAAIGGSAEHLSDLGLLEPFEDVVDHAVTALAVNGLPAGRLPPLTEAEQADLAVIALPALFAAWGGVSGSKSRPYSTDILLTRLGLAAGNGEVVDTCAADAVRGLQERQVKDAASLGQASAALLERLGMLPSLRLLSWTGEALRTIGEGEAAAAMLAKGEARLAEAEHELDPGQLSNFLFALGNHQEATGLIQPALATFERLCALQRKRGNDRQLAVARGRIADILQARGELDEALRIRREEELPVYTRLGDVRSVALTQTKIADILQARGELDEALRIHREERLPVYTRLGDVRSVALTQGRIADIRQARGELDEALRIRREEELPVYTRLGDVRSVAVTQGKIADILQARGALDEALRIRREETLPVYTRLGDVRSVAVTQGKIADILEARGELDEALRIHREETLPVYTRLGDMREIAVAQGKIAQLLAQAGNVDEALKLQVERLATHERMGDINGTASTLWDIAQIELARDQIDQALPRLAQAWPLLLKLGRADGIAAVGATLGQILAAAGMKAEAAAVLGQSAAAFRKLGRVADAAAVEQIIAGLN